MPEPTQDAAAQEQARAALAQRWADAIQAQEKARSKWAARCEKIISRYKDERKGDSGTRRINILWSNIETLLPSIYAQTPKPKVRRKHADRAPIARATSLLLERALIGCADQYDVDAAFEAAAKDRLLVGIGQVWSVYAPDLQTNPDGTEYKAYEKAFLQHVHWKDYLEGPGRSEDEIEWKARRIYLSRKELNAAFGERAKEVKLDYSPDGRKDEKDEGRKKAAVWEVWDKTSGEVLHIAPGSGASGLLSNVPAPISYEGFFPCPAALRGTTAGDDLIPTPDYVIYQDQAMELDELTARIGLLQSALAVRGVYDSSLEGLKRLLSGDTNELIPIDNWAAFAERGGVKGAIDFLPIDQIVTVLVRLYEARAQMKQDLYEISGIADIMRGAGDPDETATAQSIKAQWGSRRVRRLQRQVQRFARDAYRLKAEVMAEHFEVQELARLAGYGEEDGIAEKLGPIGQLLRDEGARAYRIDIETDSTLEADEQAEKQSRTEFTTAVTAFLAQAGQIAAGSPAMTQLMGQLLMFAVRGFPAAGQLEEAIEEALAAFQKEMQAKAQQPPQPDPRLEAEKARLQLQAQKVEGDLAIKQRQVEGGLQIQAARLAAQTPMPVGPPA